jgi:hypothetical protein
LWRGKNRKACPAEMANDPTLLAGQERPARHTRSRQQKVQRGCKAVLNCEAG